MEENNQLVKKQKIRSMAKQKRDSLGPEERQSLSSRICSHIQEHPWFVQAETVYFYYPLGSEVDLRLLAEVAIRLGKQTAFPRVHRDGMEFYKVSGMEGFSQGAFHVMEPVGNYLVSDAAALALVPGLAFDRQGGRMGYGKGYYDKYFARYPGCRKLGVCYGIQLIPKTPCGQHDISMDGFVTEQGVVALD